MAQYDDRTLDRFLLDELHSSEREELEQRIFVDDELFSRVEERESDLIDSFVRNELDSSLRERFERSLVTNPARQQKVLFGRILDRKLSSAAGRNGNVVPFARRHSSVLTAALAAALLIIVIGVPSLMRKATPATDSSLTSVSNHDRLDADEQVNEPVSTATDSAETIAAPSIAVKRPPVPTLTLETPAPAMTPVATSLTFVLSTVSLRSGTGLSTLEIQRPVDLVVFQLGIESAEFPSYNVDIRNSSGSSVWSEKRLPLTTVEGAPAVSFEVPASVLNDGRHELVLAGVSTEGTEEIAYVDFAVRHRP